MKKIILMTLSILMFYLSNGQTNFIWEVTDSVAKTKAQLYSDSKMFIAKNWNSSKDVIQNDDKEAGVILIKGTSIMKVSFMTLVYVYVYNYTVTFKMKDNKYKISIDNVYCESAYYYGGNGSVAKIQPFDGENCPETGTFKAPGITKKKAIPMMMEFKKELQSIIDNYESYIKNPSSLDNTW